MVRHIKLLIGHIIIGSSRPGWTLLAICCLLSAAFVLAVRP
jgi:hypothetical protein